MKHLGHSLMIEVLSPTTLSDKQVNQKLRTQASKEKLWIQTINESYAKDQ